MELFTLFGKIATNADEANKDIDGVTNKAKDSEGKMTKAFKNIGKAVVTAFAVEKIIGFGKTLIETTAKIQALDSQFEQTFKGDQAKAMDKITAQAQAQGIHVDRLKGTWASFYGTFKGNGADANQSLDLTEKYMKLAADGAAYYDLSLEDVSSRLKSITMGNFEAGDAIGVNINATKMDIKAKEQYGKAWKDLTDTEKEYLLVDTVGKIYENSGAMGQGSREANNWSNVTENLRSTWERFLKVIGSPVLKVATKVVQGLAGVIEQLTAKIERFNPADFVSSLNIPQPLIDNVMYFAEMLKELVSEFIRITEINAPWIFKGLKNVFEALMPILDSITNVFINVLGTALVIVFDLLTDGWVIVSAGIQIFLDLVKAILDNVKPAWDSLCASLSEYAALVLDVWQNTIKPFIDSFIEMILDLWAVNGDKINKIGELFGAVGDFIAEKIQWVVNFVKAHVIPFIQEIVTFISNHMDNIRGIFEGALDIISGILDVFIGIFTGNWSRAWEGVKSIFSGAWDIIKNGFQIAVDGIGFIWDKIGDILMAPINWAIDKITGAVNKIKDIFSNMFPVKVKLPHFNVSGSMNPLSWDENGPPKLGIEWYANGGILTKPMPFGINPSTGNVMAGGEPSTGGEAIMPLNKLPELMAEAMRQAGVGSQPIVINIDGREFAIATAPYMDEELGFLASKNRYRR